jgi:hypothetical protein
MMKTTARNSVLTLLITLSALALSAKASAAVIVNAQTAIEANLAAGNVDGDPNSSAWFYGTDWFESYGNLTAADWNGGSSNFSYKAGSILQWDLTGFENPGDTIGTVNSASFKIMGKNSGGNSYKVYRLTDAIDGSTTWNTKPLLDTTASVSFTMAANYSLQTIDVSSLLANNGVLTTFGLAVLCDNYIGGENFWSTAYGNQFPTYSSQNLLNANYAVNAIPEPSTYALVVGGIATLLLIRRRVQA